MRSRSGAAGLAAVTLLGGAAEILLGAPTVTMRVQVRRQPIKMIAGMVNRYASHVVVKPDILQRLGVTEASPVDDKARALKVGPGMDPQSEMGPLVTR